MVAFLFFFAIFFVNQLLLLAEEILSKDVGFWDVSLLILYSLPAIISFTFPFASLVGGLMAIGRLSSDREIIAFMASGVSYRLMFMPLLVVGLLLSLVSFVMGDYFLPRGTMSFGKLYREILFSNPSLELEAYSVKNYQDSTIVTGAINQGLIKDLLILDTTEDGGHRRILAQEARLSENRAQQGVISLSLRDVFGHVHHPRRDETYSYFNAEEMIYNILLRDVSFSIGRLTPREMSSVDVYHEIQEKRQVLQRQRSEYSQQLSRQSFILLNHHYAQAVKQEEQNFQRLHSAFQSYSSRKTTPPQDQSLRIHLLEFHKKIAIPFGCLAFVFFFFPVGNFSRKSGRSLGFGIGLVVSVLYWALLFSGQTLGMRMNFSPVLSMWAPNIIVILIGLILYKVRLIR